MRPDVVVTTLALLLVGCAPAGDNVFGVAGAEGSGSSGAGTDVGSASSASPTTGAVDDSDGGATGEGPKFDVAISDGGLGSDESTCAGVATILSSAGCLFAPWVGISLADEPWAVVAANSGQAPANVTLTSKDGVELEAATVQPGELHVFELTPEDPLLHDHINLESTHIETKAMRLESDVPIVAYQFTPYSSSDVASSDASLLLPAHVWGTDYLTALYANDGQPWVTVLSLEDDNEVTITAPESLVGQTLAGAGLVEFAPGQAQQVVLGAQQILKIRDNGLTDFTGFRVQSSKPVAVTVGAPTMSIPGPASLEWRDYLEEQVPPRVTWGTRYVAAKFHERGGEDDLYRFVADQDGTTITLSDGVSDVLALDAGEFADVATAASFVADGDKPFLVEHLMFSQAMTHGPKDDAEFPGGGQSGNCFGGADTTHVGDPSITFLAPVDQFRDDYTFLTPETFAWDFLTVVAKQSSWDMIELDGAPLPVGPTPIGGSGYARGSFAIADGPHVIAGNAAFAIEVYGYDCHISYAYAGGLNLQAINPPG